MDNQYKEIEQVILLMKKRYEAMLSTFRPAKKTGEYLEQNMITNFAIAFSSLNPEAKFYTEIPFMCGKENFWKCRLDLYIDNGDTGFLIEFKGSLSNNKLFEAIDNDIIRLKSKNLKNSFKDMSIDNNLPKQMIALVIADCWGEKGKKENKQATKWENSQTSLKDFQNINLLKYKKSYKVDIEKSDYPYNFLVGVVEFDLWK